MRRLLIATILMTGALVGRATAEDCAKSRALAASQKTDALIAQWAKVTEKISALPQAERARRAEELASVAAGCPIGSRVGKTVVWASDTLTSIAGPQSESIASARGGGSASAASVAKAGATCSKAGATCSKAASSAALAKAEGPCCAQKAALAKAGATCPKAAAAAALAKAEGPCCAQKAALAKAGATCPKTAAAAALAKAEGPCCAQKAALAKAEGPCCAQKAALAKAGATCPKTAAAALAKAEGCCQKTCRDHAGAAVAAAPGANTFHARQELLRRVTTLAHHASLPMRAAVASSATGTGFCPTRAAKLAALVREAGCESSAAEILVKEVPGLDVQATAIAQKVRAAGCEKSAASIVLATAKSCAKRCSEKTASFAALQSEWKKAGVEFASLPTERKEAIFRGMAERAKKCEVTRLIPQTIATLREDLEVLVSIDGRLLGALREDAALRAKVGAKRVAELEKQAATIRQVSEVLGSCCGAMHEARSSIEAASGHAESSTAGGKA